MVVLVLITLFVVLKGDAIKCTVIPVGSYYNISESESAIIDSPVAVNGCRGSLDSKGGLYSQIYNCDISTQNCQYMEYLESSNCTGKIAEGPYTIHLSGSLYNAACFNYNSKEWYGSNGTCSGEPTYYYYNYVKIWNTTDCTPNGPPFGGYKCKCMDNNEPELIQYPRGVGCIGESYDELFGKCQSGSSDETHIHIH